MKRPLTNRQSVAPAILIVAVAAGSLLLSSCGGGDDSGPPSFGPVPEGSIALVGDTGISEATYERRLKSELRGIAPLSGAVSSSRMVDPPRFTRCIAGLERLTVRAAGGAAGGQSPPAATRAQLRENCEQQFEQIRSGTVTELIEEQWAIQSAADEGFELSDEQVRERLDQLESTRPAGAGNGSESFAALLKRSGLRRADLEDQLRATLAGQASLARMSADPGTPSDEELEEFYSGNPQLFGRPGERTIEVVAVSDESVAEDAASRIEGGESVSAVSVELSDDVAVLGGDGFLTLQQGPGPQPAGLVDEVFSAPAESLVGPVEVDGNWYVFRVVDETAAKVPAFEKIRDEVAGQAASALIQKAQIEARNELQAEWRPKTVCAEKYVVPQCSNGPELPEIPLP